MQPRSISQISFQWNERKKLLIRLESIHSYSVLWVVGVPTPFITWRRNRVTVIGQTDLLDEPGRIRSTLILPPLKRSDWPLTLSCSASNSDKSRPLEQSFDLDIERKLMDTVSSLQSNHKAVLLAISPTIRMGTKTKVEKKKDAGALASGRISADCNRVDTRYVTRIDLCIFVRSRDFFPGGISLFWLD